MAGKVIGTKLPFGFRGAVSRTPDTIIAPYPHVGADPIQFGEPVAFDATNKGVRKVAATDTASAIVGIAVRRVGQPYADDEHGWYYKQGDVVDVLLRGSIAVEVASDTGITARGAVYVCKGSGDNAAGSIVCAIGDDTLEMPNTVFAIGECDANKIAEVTILTRSI